MARAMDRSEPHFDLVSRVSWGPILAGALSALGVFITLSLLGAAVGLSARDSLDREELGLGAGLWSIAALAIGLFVGGWVVSKCVVGESRDEAILNGTIVWGTTLTLLMLLTGSNIGTGVAASSGNAMERVSARAAAPATVVEDRAVDREDDDRLDATRNALWGAFAAALGALGAAVAGALVGPYEVVRRGDRELRRDEGRTLVP